MQKSVTTNISNHRGVKNAAFLKGSFWHSLFITDHATIKSYGHGSCRHCQNWPLWKYAGRRLQKNLYTNVDPLTNMALQGALQHHRTFSSQRMKSATSMNGWPHLLLSYSRTSSLMHCPDPIKMIYYLYRSSSAVYAHIKSGNILNSAYQLRSFPEFVCTSVALLHPPSFSMRCPDPFKKWIYYLTRSSSTVSCRPAMASLLIGPMGLKNSLLPIQAYQNNAQIS